MFILTDMSSDYNRKQKAWLL